MLSAGASERKRVVNDGPNGLFEIGLMNGTREDGTRYQYRDATHRFFFYAETYPEPIGMTIVDRAFEDSRPQHLNLTGQAVQNGSPLWLDPSEETVIRQNIEFVFRARRSFRLEQEVPPKNGSAVVSFAWRVA